MKKKEVLYIIFILLLIPSVYAINRELIYSDYVYPGQSLNVSNEIFTFSLSSSNDQLSVTLPSGSGFILGINTSKIKDDYDIYFTGTSFWYHNYTLDKDFYKAYVKIYNVLPNTAKLELTRTFEGTELLINEQTEIEVIIKNIGDIKATNIIYTDSFPKTFEITEISEGLIEYTSSASAIKWTGNLLVGNEEKLSYKIKALEKAEFESKASLSYNNGTGTVEIYSDAETITVLDYQLNVSMDLDKDKIEIGEESNLNINLTNINNENDIRAELSITIPQGLRIVSHKYLDKDSRKLSWKDTLSPGESKSFNIRLEGVSKKIFTLKPEIIFTINDITKNIEKNLNLNVGVDIPTEPTVIKTVPVAEEPKPEEIKVEEEEPVVEESEPIEEEPVKEIEEEKVEEPKEEVKIKKNNIALYKTLVIIFSIISLIITIFYVKKQIKRI